MKKVNNCNLKTVKIAKFSVVLFLIVFLLVCTVKAAQNTVISSEIQNDWDFSKINPEIVNGKIIWQTGEFGILTSKFLIPMEDVIIVFDGYAETNGINIFLLNDNQKGYTYILGGWFNASSGSDVGASGENRVLVQGAVWTPKKWHQYKLVRNGDILAAYCDDIKIFSRTEKIRFPGWGKLAFNSWQARIGIANLRVYKIGATDNTIFYPAPGTPTSNTNLPTTTFPTKWQVNCNGYIGLLVYSVDLQTKKLKGTLLGTPVEGYLVGRHMVLHRAVQGDTQIYDGWIIDHKLGASGQPYYQNNFIIAGTLSEYKGSVDGVYPWYGIGQ